jgi:exonuclease SbcD
MAAFFRFRRRSLEIAHFSDLHYSQSNAMEADRCFAFAVSDAIRRGAQFAVISGDSTDHRLDAHASSLHLLASRIHELSKHMPVLMLQGTFSHEPPGTLDNFNLMGVEYPVYVADRIQQVALYGDVFRLSKGAVFSPGELEWFEREGADVVITCVPTVNKAVLAAAVGTDSVATELGDHLSLYLTAAGKVNRSLRSAGVRTIGVSHGTVSGCQTEHGVPMIGFDHEFTLGSLFDAECDAFMLGHIHKHQQWSREGRVIAYPGSIGRFHYGEEGGKGYLLWQIEPGVAHAAQVATPARETLCIDFAGPPDMEKLASLAADSADKFVRVRWQLNEEHRQLVDRDAVSALFARAAELKIEARILPAVRSRAQGISNAATLEEKLGRWCELTKSAPSPLLDRLGMLQSADVDSIVAGVLASLSVTDVSHSQPLGETPASPLESTECSQPSLLDEPSWLTSAPLFEAA